MEPLYNLEYDYRVYSAFWNLGQCLRRFDATLIAQHEVNPFGRQRERFARAAAVKQAAERAGSARSA